MSGCEKPEKSPFNSISSAPKRPEKKGSVQKIVRNEDMFKSIKNGPFEEIVLSDDDDDVTAGGVTASHVKCPHCPRDMTLWSTNRREIHIKLCALKCKTTEKSAAKPVRKLTETLEKNDKLIEKPSTSSSEGVRPPSKTWHTSKNNVKFARIAADDDENRRRKRPRSFAVVELAPKKCQCDVVETLHSRFMQEFHSKSIASSDEKTRGLTEQSFQMRRMLEKIARFEQLSQDFRRMLDDPVPSRSSRAATIRCADGVALKACATVLKHRTTLLKTTTTSSRLQSDDVDDDIVISMEEWPSSVVSAWLVYVFTAKCEWSADEVGGVGEICEKYGPVGLDLAVKGVDKKPEKPEDVEARKTSSSGVVVVEDVVVATTPPPVDPFESDDPLIGFGRAEIDVEVEDVVVVTPSPQKTSLIDSFDEWSASAPKTPKTSTPTRTTTTPKPVFGSNVRILKTNDVTPMPDFERMDESELKERMRQHGMRPRGRKAMIATLRDAYTTLHPEVCVGTPTLRPLVRILEEREDVVGRKKTTKRKSLNERLQCHEEETEEADAEKTLNLSTSSGLSEVFEAPEEDVDETARNAKNRKPKEETTKAEFLAWLRSERNAVLHEHVISMQPLSLEELLVRLEKEDGPLGRIGKQKLAKMLESMSISFQLPQKSAWKKAGVGRRGGGGFRKKI